MALFGAIVVSLMIICGVECSSGRHHVVGEDRGWDPSSDVSSWASRRTFLLGDSLWFTYSAAHEKIVELSSKEEYEACDLRNPIKMYTDGLSRVILNTEGIRYFASANSDTCKKGLKLPVEVKQPNNNNNDNNIAISEEAAVASAPSSPSSSTHLAPALFTALFLLCFYL